MSKKARKGRKKARMDKREREQDVNTDDRRRHMLPFEFVVVIIKIECRSR